MMAVLFGLLTALANASAVSTQHVASTSGSGHRSGWQLFLFLLRQPLWLLGWVAMACSLIFQALALHFGPLSVVQPLLVSELLMALIVRRLWLRQSLGAVTWLVAAVTGAGLVLFLIASSPHGGSAPPTSSWLSPSMVCLVSVGVLVVMAQRGSPRRKAALFASATAIMWALEATYIKISTDVLSTVGVGGLFTRWPIYALIIAGVVGLFCEQAALHVGPLSVAQPLIVIVDPLVSVLLGIWIYREHVAIGGWSVVGSAASFVVVGVGVVMLTKLAPPTMNRDVHRL